MWLEVAQSVTWTLDGIDGGGHASPLPVARLIKGMRLNVDEAKGLLLLRDFPMIFLPSPGPKQPNWEAGWKWIAAFRQIMDAGMGETTWPPVLTAAFAKCDEGYAGGDVALFMAGIGDLRQWCVQHGISPFFCEHE